MTEKEVFLSIFEQLNTGNEVSPRGMKVKELEDFNYKLEPYQRFCNFEARKLSINYIKKEFLWYLRGDRFDLSIGEYAKMWSHLVSPDGGINSNYGQYIFKEGQFDYVVETFKEDKDSRRAIIVILNTGHLLNKTPDVPCTVSLSFRIRNNKLNMSVHMRSQDVIFGMGNDAPAFSFIHEMILNALKEYYPDLQYGTYHHIADSFHIYEKHFGMMGQILSGDGFVEVHCPKISGPSEVKFLRNLEFEVIPEEYEFAKWLLS